MRKQPTQERARQTVAAILEATRQLLVAGPLDSFTADDVAQRAGVSVGTLYQYFEHKTDLVRSVGERHIAEVVSRLASLRAPTERGPALLAYAREVLRVVREAHEGFPRLHETLEDVGLSRTLREALSRHEQDQRHVLERVAARLSGRENAAAGALAYDLVERFAHKRVAPDEPGETVDRLLDTYASELARVLAGEN